MRYFVQGQLAWCLLVLFAQFFLHLQRISCHLSIWQGDESWSPTAEEAEVPAEDALDIPTDALETTHMTEAIEYIYGGAEDYEEEESPTFDSTNLSS